MVVPGGSSRAAAAGGGAAVPAGSCLHGLDEKGRGDHPGMASRPDRDAAGEQEHPDYF